MIFKEGENILIVSAHADDHTRAAGPIFRGQEEYGMSAYEIVYTDSSKGQDYKAQEFAPAAQVKEFREKELSEASRYLGIMGTKTFGVPDYTLVETSELVYKTAQVIRDVRPHLMFLPNPEDRHRDHRNTTVVGLSAIDLAAMNANGDVGGKPYRVPVVLFMEMTSPMIPDILIDITKYQDKVRRLWEIYGSQNSPNLTRCLEGKQKDRAYGFESKSVMAAEGYSIPKTFPALI